MNTTRILRSLALVGLLVFLAPFYDACDGKQPFQKVSTKEIAKPKTISEKVKDIVINEEAYTGYEIASIFVYEIRDFDSFSDFKKELRKDLKQVDWYTNCGMLVSFVFDIKVLLALAILLISFTSYTHWISKLSRLTIILVLLTFTYIITLDNSFSHFHQIKWGYYAFFIVNSTLYYFSLRQRNTN